MSSEIDSLPLIRTKLYRPRITAGLVPRPRRLEQRRDRPLTLFVAPAGYGKTTLVSSWLDDCAHPSIWLSPDAGHSDLSVFPTYLVGAVRTEYPDACSQTSSLLQSHQMPPPLVRLRASEETAELRMADLRFTLNEVQVFWSRPWGRR